MADSIVLASSSPRRKQLLEWAEIAFEVIVKPVDETFPVGIKSTEAAIHIALKKANAVQEEAGADRIIVAADTVVVLNEKIIGKPADQQEAIHTLTQLQGKTHEVVTGVAILKGEKQLLFADVTEVTFNPLTPEQILFYVEKYQPYDKAGAYAIQEWIGVVGIRSIKGDFYNVMGLPVNRVVQALANI